MPEFLKAPFINGPEVVPLDVCVRLLLALVFGVAVAWIYKHIRSKTQIASTFPATLVFLSVLIAMVTQVIGDNVARAFQSGGGFVHRSFPHRWCVILKIRLMSFLP